MPGADFAITDGIAVITVDNPPVNAMSPGVPDAIIASIARANADPAVKAIVLRGGGSGGIAGADIRMFGKPWPQGQATLRDVIGAIETSGRPVVAALKAHTLGGGLEIALGCHYRVASPDAAVGQPEVKLGFPPGAGGTQRLPRLAGIEAALAMIVDGNPVPARKAKALGIVDEIIEGDLAAGAVAFAKARVAAGGPHRLARDKPIERKDKAWFDLKRAEIAKKARGQKAARRLRRLHRGGGQPALRRRRQARARDLRGLHALARSQAGAAARLLRRARGGQGARHRQGSGRLCRSPAPP